MKLFESLLPDIRHALRALRATPSITFIALPTLALGIGASVAMFSVLDAVLLRELPVRAQDELVVLWTSSPSRGTDHLPFSWSELAALRERQGTLRSVGGVVFQGALESVLVDAGEPVTVTATWVTGDFFSTLGVEPVRGRALLPSDDVVGAEPVIVISHAFWQRRFGGDGSAIGHAFHWNGRSHRVVGVLPRGFEYPAGADVWTPVIPAFPGTLDAGAPPSQAMVFDVVARLAPVATVATAARDAAAFLRATDELRPPALRDLEPVVTPISVLITGDVAGTLWIATGAVVLLLLIACVNVANLLLIRGAARSRELAVRSALGAGRPRLVRQLLTESSVLAAIGGALGIGIAIAATRVLASIAPAELPRRELIAVDANTMLFAILVTSAAALLAGVLPALLATGASAGAPLRGGRGDVSADRGARSLRHALVVGQIVLAILVVSGAGLLVRSFIALQSADMGFNRDRLVILDATLPAHAQPERPALVLIQEEAVQRLAALPGVAAAAALPRPPFAGEAGWTAMYSGEGQLPGQQATNPWVNFEVVSPGYFETLEIPVQRGRAFSTGDTGDALRVAIVSDVVARQTWPGQDPIGRRIKLGPLDGPAEWHTVIGVVGETRYRDLATPHPTLYLPVRQFGGPVPLTLAARTTQDGAALLPQVRAALREVHPELMLVGGGTLRELMAEPLARPRFAATLLGAFGVLTLLLAVVGIYGALAASVRQRTREIGVRMALGARNVEVGRLVLGEGLRLAVIGCALGVFCALLATRVLDSLLFGVAATDAATYAAVIAIILAAATCASLFPALRAMRVDPGRILRSE